MNLIPHYIVILKIIRRLSRLRNGIYRFIPLKLFFWLKTRKWIRHYDKKKVKTVLSDSLGNFLQYAELSTEKASILSAANDSLNQTFDLLGSGPVKLDPIDWHSDIKSGFRWRKGKFFKDYVIIDLTNNADVKVPWELSRSHHFLWLGQAYLLTKDEKYAEAFVNQINWWIDDNPVMRSINWTCAMDVSIRAVNWLYALNMFVGSELVTDKLTRKITKSLYEHAYFIYNNLEKYFPYSGNHYASNIAGLIFLGMFFNKNTLGKKWFSFALREYFREVRIQVLPSGVHFEKSISYHRLVTELFFYTQLFLENNDTYIPLDIRARIEKMLEFVMYYTKPDGTAPMIGDDDDGRFLPFIKRPFNDHRYLLCFAAIIYNVPVMKRQANSYFNDCFFFLGKESKTNYDSILLANEALSSVSFSDAGFCVLRHQDFYLFINNSGVSMYPDTSKDAGSHTHADLLSFELAVGTTSFIVDPGTYAYTSDPEQRNVFRSTKMHNTVLVDKKNHHSFTKQLFGYDNYSKPKFFRFERTDNLEQLTGAYTLYLDNNKPITHLRTFAIEKTLKKLIISDEITGEGKLTVKIHYRFAPECHISFFDDNKIEVRNRDNGIKMELKSNAHFHVKTQNSFVSHSYGIKTPSKAIEIELHTKCPVKVYTYIILKSD